MFNALLYNNNRRLILLHTCATYYYQTSNKITLLKSVSISSNVFFIFILLRYCMAIYLARTGNFLQERVKLQYKTALIPPFPHTSRVAIPPEKNSVTDNLCCKCQMLRGRRVIPSICPLCTHTRLPLYLPVVRSDNRGGAGGGGGGEYFTPPP